MMRSTILLASIVLLALGVLASPVDVKLYTFEFEDGVSEANKRSYAEDLAGWLGKKNMDTLMIGDETVALVGLATNVESIDKKNVIKKVWLDRASKELLHPEDERGSSKRKRSNQFLNSTAAHVRDEEHLLRRGGDAVIKDTNARRELRFISMKKSQKSMAWKANSYNYKAEAGTGATIYVHNWSGINLNHAEFKQSVQGVTKGKVEYLYPQTDTSDGHYFQRGPKPTKDENGHGTCVADKAVGRLNGVAKGGNLKFVPYLWRDSTVWKLAGLQAIVNDVKKRRENAMKKRDGSATGEISVPVINLSYGLGGGADSIAVKLYRKFLQALVHLDSVIIVTAGNDGVEVFQYPAMFAREEALRDNILVVGNVRLDGSMAPSSNHGPLVDVWAPADGPFDTIMRSWDVNNLPEGIECASHLDNTEMVLASGTSLSAPQVAGLAAYFLSVDPSLRTPGSAARKVIRKIREMAWSRGPPGQGNPKSIWNGLGSKSIEEEMMCEDGEEYDEASCSCVIL